MEDDFEFESSEDTFNVNYQNIVNAKSLLSVTRLLAFNMMNNSYVSVGDFFKNMAQTDLDILMQIIDEGEDNSNFGDLMLLSEMLATGEGLEQGTLDTMHKRVNAFVTLLACESLFRKGLIKVHHHNMSFGDDMASAIVAEKR